MDEQLFRIIETFANPAYVLAIMVSAFMFVVSGPNEEKRKSAKQLFLYSTAGYIMLVVVLPVLMRVFGNFLGV